MTAPPQSCPKIASFSSRDPLLPWGLLPTQFPGQLGLNPPKKRLRDVSGKSGQLMTMLEVHQENQPEQKWQDLLWVESFQSTFQSPFLNRTSLLRLAKHFKKPSSIKKQRKKESEVAQSCPTLCDPKDCSLLGFLHQWDFPGKNTGVGCHFLLQEIFLTQGLNPGLPHCRKMLYCQIFKSVGNNINILSKIRKDAPQIEGVNQERKWSEIKK